LGIGGQRLYVIDKLRLVVAINAGLYDRADQGAIMRAILEKIVILSSTH
jgi:hypothetical protein